MNWTKIKSWLKAHPTWATFIAMVVTTWLLGIIFLVTAWITTFKKEPDIWGMVFFGYFGCIMMIFASQANLWFSNWLKKQ